MRIRLLILLLLAPLAIPSAGLAQRSDPPRRAGQTGEGAGRSDAPGDKPAYPKPPRAIGEDNTWRDRANLHLREYWDSLEGAPPPPLEQLDAFLNTPVRLWRQWQGNVVLIVYWAQWSTASREAMPDIVELHERFQERDVVILGVHAQRGFKQMEAFVEEHDLPFAFAADHQDQWVDQLRSSAMPAFFVVDRAGHLRVAGANLEKLAVIIESLLTEPRYPSFPAPPAKRLWARDVRGQDAPPISASTWLDDHPPDPHGKVKLIAFFTTWWPGSGALTEQLGKWQARFPTDLEVVAISPEPIEKLDAFFRNPKPTYPVASEPTSKMLNALKVSHVPHVLIVSTDGKVRWQGYPYLPAHRLDADAIARIIESDPQIAARRAREHRRRTAEAAAESSTDPLAPATFEDR